MLKLPEPRFEQVKVTLQDGERSRYNDIMAECALEIDKAVSSKVKIKKYAAMFAATMKLRRLCNHGMVASAPTGNGSGPDAGSGLEDAQNCDFCSGADEDAFELVAQGDFCSECGRQLRSVTSSGCSTPTGTTGPRLTLMQNKPLARNRGDTTSSTDGIISSKIQAVIDRLSRVEPGSKR